MAGDGPAVQLRLGFEAPSTPLRLTVTVTGMTAAAYPTPGMEGAAMAHLAAVGVNGKLDEVRGVLFPVRELRLLTELPDNVTVVTPGASGVLWGLVRDAPDESLPVRVSADSADILNLSWVVGGVELNEPLPADLAPALTALEIPLVASGETWSSLLVAARWIAVVGRCKLNLDGFIDIATSVPQQLEMCPIPALFRLTSTQYGCPASSMKAVESTPGLVWEGPKPPHFGSASAAPTEELPTLADEVKRTLGLVLAAATGSARPRVLASLTKDLGSDVLVLTLEHLLLEWKILIEILGVDPARVHVSSYKDFDLPPGDWGAVVFDQADHAVGSLSPQTYQQAHSLDGLAGMLRIAIVSSLPADPSDVMELMSLVRPVEFRSDIPVALRYPAPSQVRFSEHSSSYYRVLESDSEPPIQTHRVVLDDSLTAVESVLPPDQALDMALRLSSYGADLKLSPKVGLGVELARAALGKGHRCLILVRFEETRSLLLSLLRRDGAGSYGRSTEQKPIEVALVDEPWESTTAVDTIVLLDYPWRTRGLVDLAVKGSVCSVHVVHAAGGIDDPLAKFTGYDDSSPPTFEGMRWLLARMASDRPVSG